MTDEDVPSAESLKQLVTRENDLAVMLTFAIHDVTMIHALWNLGQSVAAQRDQVARLTGSDETTIAITKALHASERALDRAAHATYLVLVDIHERKVRRESARFN